jgi:hypothetical protein
MVQIVLMASVSEGNLLYFVYLVYLINSILVAVEHTTLQFCYDEIMEN